VTEPLKGLDIVAEVVRRHYDVGQVHGIEQLAMAHQRRHRKMVVTTDDGRFLVKTYKLDPVVLDALRFQHRLSDHLTENEVPVAEIKRARDGRGIVELQTWAMELQRFVSGEAMHLSTDTLTTSSKALGRFHQVCRGFPCPPRDVRMWRFSEVPRTPFQRLFEAAKAERDADSMTEYCNEMALFLHDAAQELSIEKRSEFETGLIHGDWHGGNLLFDGEQLTAIVDLEFAGDGCYLEDMAYAMSNLCLRTTADVRRMEFRANIILDNYQFSRDLSYSEMVSLYYAAGVKHITTVSYQIRQHDGTVAGYTAAQWMERLAAQCRWLRERAHKVRFGH
jgi:Ser/Thr protein kinase RdoA (MazF antagonist)